MKKATPANRQSAKKPKSGPKTLDEYFATLSEPARARLSEMRRAIRSAVPPQATEVLSYRIPAFKHNGVLVWYAAFANHCSLFPTASVIDAFKNELEGYTKSKGTIQFPIDEPLPAALIKKIVKARVVQNESKKRQRS